MSNGQFEYGPIPVLAGEALPAYRLVKLGVSSGALVATLADVGDTGIAGLTGVAPTASGAMAAITLLNQPGTKQVTAGGVITVGDALAVANDGKVVEWSDEGEVFGVALESAAANNNVIEVLPLFGMVPVAAS